LKIPAVETAVEASSSAAALAVRGNRVIGETEMVSAGKKEKGMGRPARRTQRRAMQAGNRRRCKLQFQAAANRMVEVRMAWWDEASLKMGKISGGEGHGLGGWV